MYTNANKTQKIEYFPLLSLERVCARYKLVNSICFHNIKHFTQSKSAIKPQPFITGKFNKIKKTRHPRDLEWRVFFFDKKIEKSPTKIFSNYLLTRISFNVHQYQMCRH